MSSPLSSRPELRFHSSQSAPLNPYLPPLSVSSEEPRTKPFVTLTFATSLDSNLSLAPGVQTALSGPESKAMTHYLRSKHDAILVGVGTAIADDPSLNCRIEGVGGYGGHGLDGQPQPVVLDPQGRWDVDASRKVVALAREGRGRAPWVLTRNGQEEKKRNLQDVGGDLFTVAEDSGSNKFEWRAVLELLASKGIKSIMIEGGGAIINDLLSMKNFGLIDSVVVTLAPTWLGQGGVQVCPKERVENGVKLPVMRLTNVKWVPLGEDVVLCGQPNAK